MAHAAVIYAFNSSLHELKYIARNPLLHLREGEEKMSSILADIEKGKAFWWMFYEKSTDSYAGYGGFFHVDPQDRKAELGYGLLEPFWGKGLTSEALKPIVDFVDCELDLHRLVAMINPANSASRRVVEKLGFHCEGCMRDDGFARGTYFDNEIHGRINPFHKKKPARGGPEVQNLKHG